MKNKKYISVLALSKLANCCSTTINMKIKKGSFPAPTHVLPNRKKIGGKPRKYYLTSQVPSLLEQLASKPNTQHGLRYKQRRKDGFYTTYDVAAEVGISRTSILHHLKAGHIEGPTHSYDHITGFCYNKSDLRKIKAYFKAQPSCQRNRITVDDEVKIKLTTLAKKNNLTIGAFIGGLINAFEQFERESKNNAKKAT